MANTLRDHTLGWIGAGGGVGVRRAQGLLKSGCAVPVWTRPRAKAEPLAKDGAKLVDTPAALGNRDIVFITVAASHDLVEIVTAKNGLLSRNAAPKIVIDCSTVSEEASAEARAACDKAGAQFLAAPVSGNAKVVKAAKLSFVVSGPRAAYEAAKPYLDALGKGSAYVGEGELSRIVKICHNVLLGVVTQSLAEITVLAEKRGVPRHAFLDFINQSVMGSTFSRYKSPAFVNLDWTPTFTPVLLKKDMDLGLAAARELGVPMPVAAATREVVQALVGNGYVDCDFATLLELEARNAGVTMAPENVKLDDGLGPPKA